MKRQRCAAFFESQRLRNFPEREKNSIRERSQGTSEKRRAVK